MLYTFGSLLSFSAVTAVLMATGAREVIHAQMTIGSYVAFYSYLLRLFDPFSVTVEMYARLKRTGSSIQRVMELQTLSPRVCEAESACSLVEAAELRVENVKFQYSSNVPVLRNCFNLELRRGEKLALLGRSGSGKSTLAKLLVRVYDPAAGGILIDNICIRDLKLRNLRDYISLVSQREPFFEGTIRSNLLIHGRQPAQAELDYLAYITCFDSVLKKFPDGWDHVLGPGGAGLSEGERQRLALLRMLLHQGAILVLDEATSALDSPLEHEFLSRFTEYARNKIVLLITHRPAAAAWADSVLVIGENGLRCYRGDELRSGDSGLVALNALYLEPDVSVTR